ncbi:MAG: pyrroloquinoline quinone-dependent dehydrogenase [Gemmatimonadaceae bacterium]
MPRLRSRRLPTVWVSRVVVCLANTVVLSAGLRAQTVDWPTYGGSADNVRYSTLSQINPRNVRQLKVAWTYETHDEFPGSEMQSNPIVIDGVLYATTPKLRVFALDAATGKELWSFDPNTYDARPGRYRHRGVTVYKDRVLVTHRNHLWALDRKTGKPIPSFGNGGQVDLREGFDRPASSISVSASTPGVIFDDLYILGSSVAESLPSSPGDIRAFDVMTGQLRWTFHTIPRPGEFGYESWPPDAWKITGGVNAWAGLTVDPVLGMVFAATGSAAFDFYGSNRIGDDLFANSVLALDARTGTYVWHFQTVKHDLWDMDLPAPPALVSVRRNGALIPAVAQITKTGFVFVFDRKTGTPLFPIEQRAVPASRLAGERASTTQPIPMRPPPFIRQGLTADMLTRRTPAAHKAALETFRRYRDKGMFTPPSAEGLIVFPGYDGGSEWGGPAFDPETGLLYVNANEMAWLLRMLPRDDRSLYRNYCASCHRDDMKGTPGQVPSLVDVGTRLSTEQIATMIRQGTGRMPAFGEQMDGGAINDLVKFLVTGKDAVESSASDPLWLAYRNDGYNIFLDPDGYPAITPPWGSLSAIDLNRGTIRWKIPFGTYPALAAKGLTRTGSDNYGGPVVTQNGLLFIGASTYDKKFHAFDKRTGRLLWEAELPASGNATPSLYQVNGKEYVVIACGGGKNGAASGGTFVAFALPE